MDFFSQLAKMGFVECGEFILENGKVKANLLESIGDPDSQHVLYAFIVDREVVYIGKTIRGLGSRMQNYCTPHKTQLTNTRNNVSIRDAINSGKHVKIYALPDNGLLHYGGFHVNLAAGLEDALVHDLDPRWNGREKDRGEGSDFGT
jgi:hypothetical protein